MPSLGKAVGYTIKGARLTARGGRRLTRWTTRRVARSAAVPRLLPASLRLSEAGARASVFGTLAGAAVAPIGLLAFKIGPQWPLRVATALFVVGTVVALRLPARVDSDQPETVPAIFRRGTKALTRRL